MNSENNKRKLFAVLATSALTLCGAGVVTASFSNSYFSLGEEKTYQLLMNKNKKQLSY